MPTTQINTLSLHDALPISKYGKDYYKRVVATTDANKGSLYELSKAEGFDMFVIPDDIGGRFSVLTPVGLFPFAVKGYNIDRSEEHTSELQSRPHLVCRLLL